MTEAVATEWGVPEFSLAERDRRWGRVRELMANARLDALIAIGNTGLFERNQSDSKYLSQLGRCFEEVSVVFPLAGEVTAVMRSGGHTCGDSWLADIRGARWDHGATLAATARDRGLDGQQIGICGLQGGEFSLARVPDGVVNHGMFEQLRRALPHAEFVDATPIMEEARWIKSDEEVEFLRRATAIAEAGLRAVAETSHVGIREPEVYVQLVAARIRAGGDEPAMVGWISGPAGRQYRRLQQPVDRVLGPGDALDLEVEGRYGGYVGQGDDTFAFGAVPDGVHAAHAAAVAMFNRALGLMKPGVTFGKLIDASEDAGTAGARARLTLHGRGAGDDGPLVTGGPLSQRVLERPLAVGNVFILKPSAEAEGTGLVGRWGDTVVVREHGAERLGTRPQRLVTVS
jgi:Xaa-Pro aminopeptidase